MIATNFLAIPICKILIVDLFLFCRCGKGFGALKDQGTTNQIVYRFIVDYNSLFLDPGEDPPAVYWVRPILLSVIEISCHCLVSFEMGHYEQYRPDKKLIAVYF